MMSSSPTVALRPGGTQLLSTGHGSWIRTGNGKFAATTVNMHSDPADATTGFSITNITFNLNEALNELAGQFKTDVYDPNGVLLFSLTGEIRLTLIVVQPLAP
jgi:hypothetical protein